MPRRRLLLACLMLAVTSGARAAPTKIRIAPGPEAITDSERAIEADPAAGIEHAVILVDESQLNDAYGAASEFQHHVRAKVLSNEARDLADVEILLMPDEKLTGWWGFVVQPDGQVLRLEESELIEQSLVRVGRYAFRSLGAPLPGVVPGSIIDYGYTTKGEYFYAWRVIPLQRRWPVRELVYRWKPADRYSSAFRVYRHEGLDIEADQDRDAVRVSARDLPGVVEEPRMPPEHEVRASVTLYYLTGGEGYKDFWKDLAAEVDRRNRSREPGELARRVLTGMADSDATTLPDRLRAAYDWLVTHVSPPEDESDLPFLAGLGGPRVHAIDQAYLEVARALGAEAHVVLAPDRRERLWDPELKSDRQLPESLVAVRAPGEPDEAAILADPSSGLPFGVVPWWSSGVRALLATSRDVRPILVPTSSPTENTTRTEIGIRFDVDEAAMTARWETIAEGQAALTLSRTLDRASERDRRAFCGEGPDADSTQADFDLLPGKAARLRCGVEVRAGGPGAGIGRYHFGWNGLWIAPLPDLPVGARVHPVLFDYPQVEFSDIEVTPPAGFVPGDLPEDRSFETPFGKYRVHYSTTGNGIRVERALAQLAVLVPPADYDALLAFFDDVRAADDVALAFVHEDVGP